MPTDPVYDCIVVGAGAAGIVVASKLAHAGKHTLLIERGDHLTYAIDGRRDHLRNQRLSRHGHNAGPPAGNPRVLVTPDGSEHVLEPWEPGYSNNAAAVGGGTPVYGMQAWRFHPDDFRMASRYGVPAGSSLADWPIAYDDLAPFYEEAEWTVGVAGDADGNRNQGPRAKAYPMPPVPRYAPGNTLARGAAALGIGAFTPPLLLNTVPHDGRAACIQCGSCVGFTCPSDSKNGTHNAVLPKALATGALELMAATMVAAIETDAVGKVTGVTIVGADGARRAIRSRAVVLSAGAVETARLLLASRSKFHPQGLGNAYDQVGRHLQGHYYPGAFGLFEHDVYEPRGPGVSIATTDFSHGNDDVIGGAMLADDFVPLPIIFFKQYLPPDLPRWGLAAKDFMRRNYRRVINLRGPVQEIPSPDGRVTLDPGVTDKFGLAVVRLSGTTHPETVRTADFIGERARDWLRASGAIRVWGEGPVLRLSGGQHQSGTCRMGDDPATSVTDRWGRVWDHDNLFVSDASLHPTNGGFNPVLTIMALAFRNGAHVAASL